MIHEYLNGEDNPITGKELSKLLEIEKRHVEMIIQMERREGYPICANSQGYYLARTPEEIDRYCAKLKRQGIEIFKTRQALIKLATDHEK
mgnify:CR=1 FL=1